MELHGGVARGHRLIHHREIGLKGGGAHRTVMVKATSEAVSGSRREDHVVADGKGSR